MDDDRGTPRADDPEAVAPVGSRIDPQGGRARYVGDEPGGPGRPRVEDPDRAGARLEEGGEDGTAVPASEDNDVVGLADAVAPAVLFDAERAGRVGEGPAPPVSRRAQGAGGMSAGRMGHGAGSAQGGDGNGKGNDEPTAQPDRAPAS
jgi:hypothetical protein